MYRFNRSYFDYIDSVAATSAGPVIDVVSQALAPRSVLDVGCCHGLWIAEWRKRGITDVMGIDGDYIERKELVMPASAFIAHDLTQPLRIGRKFDLVQCLEVAEHIPAEHTDILIDCLTAHGDMILFSSATRGQGGEFHVNEQRPDYWIAKFARAGYQAFDFLRPRIRNQHNISPWYRYNTLLFVNEAGRARLSEDVTRSLVKRDEPAAEYGSPFWRLRCEVVRLVPPSIVSALARFKHKFYRHYHAKPTIHLFSDVLGPFGGIETYLDALARHLKADDWPVQVAVSCNDDAPFLDDLEALGIPVYRQPVVPGDRWYVRQRLLIRHVAKNVQPGDWVFCVRQPMAQTYLALVRAVHRRGGKVAASWALAPEFFMPPKGRLGRSYRTAVAETDAVISVSECTLDQFREVYGYKGPLHVVRYHNRERFPAVVPLPATGTLEIGFLGRIDIAHKNLDTILTAFRDVAARRSNVRLNLHGGGPDIERVAKMIEELGLASRVSLHGPYDHRTELREIIERNHVFVYTSRFEGGPCFSLLELLQAGRFVVASPVGGIPDIYAGRSEAGDLVRQDDPAAIAQGLENALRRVELGQIDPERIRAVYREHFTEDIAHRQFSRALGL